MIPKNPLALCPRCRQRQDVDMFTRNEHPVLLPYPAIFRFKPCVKNLQSEQSMSECALFYAHSLPHVSGPNQILAIRRYLYGLPIRSSYCMERHTIIANATCSRGCESGVSLLQNRE